MPILGIGEMEEIPNPKSQKNPKSQNEMRPTIRQVWNLGFGVWDLEFRRFNQHRRLKPTQNGFTLMELMIVLVLIGIMAAMIVPEMKGSMEDALLRSSARKLVDVFNLSYSRAVSFNQLHRVRLDKSTGHYLVERQTGELQAPNDFEPVTDISGFEGQIDSRIAIEIRAVQEELAEDSGQVAQEQPRAGALVDEVNFYPDGTADGCQILLRDRMGFQLMLQVNPITGGVHLVEQEGR